VCEWYVTASLPDSTLVVHLRDFQTERWRDWLDIGEGSDNSDLDSREHHMSGRFRSWRHWQTESDKLWITFTSDQSIAYRGFLVEIEETLTEVPTEKPLPTEQPELQACGDNVTIPSGGYINITSPNYPDNYDSDLSCLWYINTTSNLRINVTFIDFHTERYFDWLEIGNGRDHTDLTTSELRVSGSDLPDPFQSSSGIIWMTFFSDTTFTRRGFHLVLREIPLE
ncbi:bone morphogenetic protein 1-like, partial [Saccoglossus kowalevskii]